MCVEGRPLYEIERTSEAGLLKLVAFASCLLGVLGEGLQTYSQVRYRQLNKRLGRMIRSVGRHVCGVMLARCVYLISVA